MSTSSYPNVTQGLIGREFKKIKQIQSSTMILIFLCALLFVLTIIILFNAYMNYWDEDPEEGGFTDEEASHSLIDEQYDYLPTTIYDDSDSLPSYVTRIRGKKKKKPAVRKKRRQTSARLTLPYGDYSSTLSLFNSSALNLSISSQSLTSLSKRSIKTMPILSDSQDEESSVESLDYSSPPRSDASEPSLEYNAKHIFTKAGYCTRDTPSPGGFKMTNQLIYVNLPTVK